MGILTPVESASVEMIVLRAHLMSGVSEYAGETYMIARTGELDGGQLLLVVLLEGGF